MRKISPNNNPQKQQLPVLKQDLYSCDWINMIKTQDPVKQQISTQLNNLSQTELINLFIRITY